MSSKLYEKTYWTAPIEYITSTYIREYDISKANINVLSYLGAITDDEYNYFYRLPKERREVMIGLLFKSRKDEGLAKLLSNGIKECRRLFFEYNDIDESRVLAIKNDAIYLIDLIPSVTQINGKVEFRHKHTYTSYYRLNRKFNKEFYYYLDTPNNIEILDISGLGKDAYKVHENFLIDFFKELFYTVQTASINEAINLLQVFSQNYLEKKLPLDYYRRFDSISGYDTKIHNILGDIYNLMTLSEKDRDLVEIGYNYGILMNLYRYVSSMAFNKK